ncbi:MAG TPA: hypothetical protein VEK77_13470 [Gemmatimonadales bacterium]|nr:hypothetical protein [Gemmatimonadales bacterium]
MKKRYLCGSLVVLLAGAGVGACSDPLTVANQNDPDRTRTFSNPLDLQVFVSGLYAVAHNATIGGSNDGLQTQMYVMSMENTSGLANFAMGPRGTIPRNPITNQRGAQGNLGNLHDFFRGHRAARQAALAIAALKNLDLGSSAAQARANAFARFAQGVALGNLSLAYDSASILTEFDNPEADASVIVALSGERAVNVAALAYLDSAIAIARASPTLTFPLPVQANFWFNGLATTQAEFIQLARSYKAIFRASVARTPAERADISQGGIVAWDSVIADANAGITANFAPQMDRLNGWDVSWYAQIYAGAQWHQMSQFWLGMADTSGNYLTYLNAANSARLPFLIVTADKRLPSGTSRTTQNAATTTAGQAFDSIPYFRNRPSGSDVSGDPLQVSMYDFWRGRQFQQAGRTGRYPVMTAAQIRLLAAEGYLRSATPNFAEAINRINVSRNGIGKLPLIPNTITDTIAVVPGGNSCTPKVPVMTTPRTLKCGNVWDALKYEYRMETAYTGYGTWFFAARGWGDLPEFTATQWPVPYNEMDARSEPFYGFGGPGGQSAAGPGNYGLFFGGVY